MRQLRPSAARRWMQCPGSVQLAAGAKDESDKSVHAGLGLAAHSLLERCLQTLADPHDLIGEDILGFPVDQDMADAAGVAIACIEAEMDRVLEKSDTVDLLIEQYLALDRLGAPGLEGGTADVVILGRERGFAKHISIVDYKHGEGVPVRAEANPQLMVYALGVAAYDWARPAHYRLMIIQPRCERRGSSSDTWTISAKDLREWGRKTLRPAALAAQGEDAALRPSDAACQFCPALARCPRLLEMAEDVARYELVSDLAPAQKQWAVEYAPLIRRQLTQITDSVRGEMLAGSPSYPRLKVVRKAARRQWRDDAAVELLDLLDGENGAVYAPPKLRGLTEIEKSLTQALGSKAEARTAMEQITYTPDPDLTIAPLDDRRAAIDPGSEMAAELMD